MKREINEELINVWSEMINDKISELQTELTKIRNEMDVVYGPKIEELYMEYKILDAQIKSYCDSLALLSSLEAGKHESKYKEIVSSMRKDKYGLQKTVCDIGLDDIEEIREV